MPLQTPQHNSMNQSPKLLFIKRAIFTEDIKMLVSSPVTQRVYIRQIARLMRYHRAELVQHTPSELRVRLEAYREARPPSTRAVFQSAWNAYAKCCQKRGGDDMPLLPIKRRSPKGPYDPKVLGEALRHLMLSIHLSIPELVALRYRDIVQDPQDPRIYRILTPNCGFRDIIEPADVAAFRQILALGRLPTAPPPEPHELVLPSVPGGLACVNPQILRRILWAQGYSSGPIKLATAIKRKVAHAPDDFDEDQGQSESEMSSGNGLDASAPAFEPLAPFAPLFEVGKGGKAGS